MDDVHSLLHFSAYCENTLAATAAGLADGANAIEIDLREVCVLECNNAAELAQGRYSPFSSTNPQS